MPRGPTRRRTLGKLPVPVSLGTTTTVTSGTIYTILLTDKTILVDDDRTGGAVRVVLPPAAQSKDRELRVKKIGSTGAVTVDGSGSETIDNSTTLIITNQYDAAHLVCDGAKWWIL